MRDRHFPGLSPAALGAILIVAFHASWLPVVLRRSALWELPVVSAVACLWWALYFLWKFHDSGGRARWAVAAGIALALLMGSRATYVLGAVAVALLLFAPAGGPGPVAGRRRGAALAAAGIAALGGFGLLAYNRARFGSWSEFGMSYMLFGEDYRGIRFFNPAFIPFNAWIYLFSLPQLGPYFPFAHPFWTDSRPAGFVGYEEIYGVIFMMPVHLAGLFALGWAWARPRRPGGGRRGAHHRRRGRGHGPDGPPPLLLGVGVLALHGRAPGRLDGRHVHRPHGRVRRGGGAAPGPPRARARRLRVVLDRRGRLARLGGIPGIHGRDESAHLPCAGPRARLPQPVVGPGQGGPLRARRPRPARPRATRPARGPSSWRAGGPSG